MNSWLAPRPLQARKPDRVWGGRPFGAVLHFASFTPLLGPKRAHGATSVGNGAERDKKWRQPIGFGSEGFGSERGGNSRNVLTTPSRFQQRSKVAKGQNLAPKSLQRLSRGQNCTQVRVMRGHFDNLGI